MRPASFLVCLMPLMAMPFASVAAVDQKELAPQIVLLGTAGGPGAMVERAGIASLLTVNGTHYLIDAGEGVDRQLVRAGVSERDVHKIFLTHLHDDHTAGLAGLATFGYTLMAGPLEIMGPPDTARMVIGLRDFLSTNAQIRGAERPYPPLDQSIIGRNIPTGLSYEDKNVKVTAVRNTHYNFRPGNDAGGAQSYSYRFEMPGKVVVFTGDTGPSSAVVELAHGADVLISEMVSAKDIASVPPAVVEHMLHEHLTPTELGKVANAAGVKKVVISHNRSATQADLAEVRKYYRGPVVIGQDLDRF